MEAFKEVLDSLCVPQYNKDGQERVIDPVESNIYRNLRRRREILETYPVTLGKDERKTPKYSPKSASCGGFKTWS